ncbi:MAG: HAD-IA family hydrolase [Actinobacteria bacterium]|nr:HAD-IA family hydrolase [Actinomycetota bacterium]
MTPRFDAVAFDLFGTLIPEWERGVWDGLLSEMADALGMKAEPFAEQWGRTSDARLTGTYRSIRENLAELAPAATDAQLDDAVARRQSVMERLVRPFDDVAPTLRHLRDRGLRTALVSMCSPEVPELWRSLPEARLIDAEVFSSEDGVRKPDPAIYALAAERLAVPAERILYVGDGSFGELTGAAAAGMTAILIRHAHEAELVIERAEEDMEWPEEPIDSLAGVLDRL